MPGDEKVDCREALARLFELLDDELDHISDQHIIDHLYHCKSCNTRLEFEKLLRERIKIDTEHVASDRLKKRISTFLQTMEASKRDSTNDSESG